MNNDELLEFVEDSRQSPYVVRDGFFVKTDERWAKVKYDEILWVRAFENGSVVFLTGERSLMVNHRLWRIEEMLTEHPNFVRINRSEIVNLDVIDGFEETATISARTRCMQRAFTANGWKVYLLRRSNSDYTYHVHVPQTVS